MGPYFVYYKIQNNMTTYYKYHADLGIHFTANSDIPMLDWDWPDTGHKTDECLTITCLNEVLDILKEYLVLYPEQAVKVYVSPGGVRAFFIGKRSDVETFFCKEGGLYLGADPLYVQLCIRNNNFPVRVSPKPNRVDDFVAVHVCTLGTPDKVLEAELSSYHDKAIKKFVKKNRVKKVIQHF